MTRPSVCCCRFARRSSTTDAFRSSLRSGAPGCAAVAQAAWVQARERNGYSLFAPYLERTIALAREYADCAGWSEHPYDAMVALYEPGETTSSLRRLFSPLRAGILPILA